MQVHVISTELIRLKTKSRIQELGQALNQELALRQAIQHLQHLPQGSLHPDAAQPDQSVLELWGRTK